MQFSGGTVGGSTVQPASLVNDILETTLFTNNGTFTPLATATYYVEGRGGGGGGGGGGGSNATNAGCGGSEGGQGNVLRKFFNLLAGTPYTVVIGAGGVKGVGGAASNRGADGGNGTDSTFNAVQVGVGAQGGRGGVAFGLNGQRGSDGGRGRGMPALEEGLGGFGANPGGNALDSASGNGIGGSGGGGGGQAGAGQAGGDGSNAGAGYVLVSRA